MMKTRNTTIIKDEHNHVKFRIEENTRTGVKTIKDAQHHCVGKYIPNKQYK